MTTPEDTELTTTKITTSSIMDSRFNRFDDEFIDKWFNEQGKQAIKDYITLHTQKAPFPYKGTYSFLHSYHKDVLEELEEHLAHLTNPTEAGEK